MVVCPICGKDVPLEEYISHFDEHEKEVESKGVETRVDREHWETVVYALAYGLDASELGDEAKVRVLNRFLVSLKRNDLINKAVSDDVWGYGHLKVKTGVSDPRRF